MKTKIDLKIGDQVVILKDIDLPELKNKTAIIITIPSAKNVCYGVKIDNFKYGHYLDGHLSATDFSGWWIDREYIEKLGDWDK
jgi:hypothetical protein